MPSLEAATAVMEDPIKSSGPNVVDPTGPKISTEIPDNDSPELAAIAEDESYLPYSVEPSPVKERSTRKTRLQARMESIVIPEPITDIPSDMEDMPAATSSTGRPAKLRKSTAAA
jgi:hypothetical protein